MNEAYQLGPLLVMAMLFLGVFMLTNAVFLGRLGAPESLGISLAIFAVFAAQMPSTAEGFYWVTGAFSNEFGDALFLILLAVLLSACRAGVSESRGRYVACSLLAIATAGSNETLLLVAFLVLTFGTAVQVISRAPCSKIWVACMLILVLAGAVAVIAPGNAERASTIHHKPALLSAGASSVRSLLVFLPAWILSPTLLAATIVVSACFYPHRRAFRAHLSRYGNRLSLLPFLWLGVLAAAFFPAYWATGVQPPARTIDSIYLFFLLGWFPSVLLIVEAWGGSRLLRMANDYWRSPLGLGILVVCFATTNNFRHAVGDLTGSARSYAMELDRRAEFLRHAQGAAVAVPTLYHLPGSIAFDDVTYDSTHWRNVAVAEFYGLKSIRRLRTGR